MLTFKNDIYEKILSPAGVIYYAPESKGYVPFRQVKNVEPTWEMLYPATIKSIMDIKSFSAINNGDRDSQNGNDGRRTKLKMHLKGKDSLLYLELEEHLNKIIRENAAIRMYEIEKDKSVQKVNLYRTELNKFIEDNGSEVDSKVLEILGRISSNIKGCLQLIHEDKRIPDELQQYIDNTVETDVIKVLEVLCILAIFSYNDDDYSFFAEVKNHFCDIQSAKESAEDNDYINGKLPKKLTESVVLEATPDTVLFRDDKANEIIEDLHSNDVTAVILSGMGGCGKTSIARLIYYKLRNKYDCCGWVNYNGDLKRSMISSIKLGDYNDETMTESDAKKKWLYILRAFANSKQSKLIVIDNVDYIEGVQNPLTDKELAGLSSWDNVKIIVTTRLRAIEGISSVYTIDNLGDSKSDEKCIELFYHYNPEARLYKDKNITIVKKLCRLADYNTMVIELLAKGSIYASDCLSDFYDKLKAVGFNYADDVPVRTAHDYSELHIKGEKEYYNIGKETAASQLIKLFNVKTRTRVERQILWDFHCLPEAEKISREELKEWLGYSIFEINALREEGWIKYEGGLFSIHPLVRQAVKCHDAEWEDYWKYAKERRQNNNISNDFISKLVEKRLFEKEDTFEERLRKIVFADCLTIGGKAIGIASLLYIAETARKSGVRETGVKYYKLSYDWIKNNRNSIDGAEYNSLLWEASYYYGYMLSYTMSGYERALELVKESYNIFDIDGDIAPQEENRYAKSCDHMGYILTRCASSEKSNEHMISEAEKYLLKAIYLRVRIAARKGVFSLHAIEQLGKIPEKLENYSRFLEEKMQIIRGEYTINMDIAEYLHDYAWSLDNLGSLYAGIEYDIIYSSLKSEDYDEQRIRDSIDTGYKCLLESLIIRTLIAEKKGEDCSTEVSWTCCNLAAYMLKYKFTSEFVNDIEKYLKEALDIYYRLELLYPGQHRGSEARTCVIYARFLARSGRMKESLEYYERALFINEAMNKEYPSVYEREVDNIRKELLSIGKVL